MVHVLHYSIVWTEAPNSDDFLVFASQAQEAPERRSQYQLHLAYTIVLRLGWGGEKGMAYFFASQPISEGCCKGCVVIGRNYGYNQPPEILHQFEETIFNHDQRIVESERPERIPFDLAAELHLKFDAVAVAYHEAMRDHRLATRQPAAA